MLINASWKNASVVRHRMNFCYTAEEDFFATILPVPFIVPKSLVNL